MDRTETLQEALDGHLSLGTPEGLLFTAIGGNNVVVTMHGEVVCNHVEEFFMLDALILKDRVSALVDAVLQVVLLEYHLLLERTGDFTPYVVQQAVLEWRILNGV